MTQFPNASVPDEITQPNLAVVLYRVGEMAGTVKEIDGKIDNMPEIFVTRREWDQRNGVVDSKIADKGREIGGIQRQLDNLGSTARGTISIFIAAGAVIISAIGVFWS